MSHPRAVDLPPTASGNVGGPLPGSISEQLIRCGKPSCRCGAGHLHGPYYYRIWRGEAGKVHKVYVRAADLTQVRARCARHLAIAEEFRAYCAEAEALWVRLRVQVARSRRLRAALARAIQANSGEMRGAGKARRR